VSGAGPTERMTPARHMQTAEMLAALGLKTDRSWVDLYAIRLPDGCWMLCMRGFGCRSIDPPDRFIDALPEEQKELNARKDWKRCGKGRAIAYAPG
jgi:hypothetical protein